MSIVFGKRIAELRKKRGYSQVNFAAKINVSKSTVGMWETGDREPDSDTLGKLANFFNVSIDYLLGRTDNPNSTLTDNVRLFVDSLELTDEQILDKISLLNVDGNPLTKEEALEFIAFVRAKRSINNKE
ncbi:helix-turn-helix domain-containing protein [Brevibacillus laterosporus]|uniref:helix-turn-helix domain-containing protein n=1 Tax=Brevibacillus laterosporus TaxID=1465 RepID=UPI0028527815|nr:helix-turn-helix domain-containing protein [Brevibacillus laterosporus]